MQPESEVIHFRVSEEFTAACRHCGASPPSGSPLACGSALEETRMERLADPSPWRGSTKTIPQAWQNG